MEGREGGLTKEREGGWRRARERKGGEGGDPKSSPCVYSKAT